MSKNLDKIIKKPSSEHSIYKKSFFYMAIAPENVQSEVIVASLYRTIGYKVYEGDVGNNGKSFQDIIQEKIENYDTSSNSDLSPDDWKKIVNSILLAPPGSGQKENRLFQLTPLIPEICLYTSAARAGSSPWNPGSLIEYFVACSPCSENEIQDLWSALFEALSVDKDDDVWAQFINNEIKKFRVNDSSMYEWCLNPLEKKIFRINESDRKSITSPAANFYQDLIYLIELKKYLTRRQWISTLEAILRIGGVSHMLWISHMNDQIWQMIDDILENKQIPDKDEIYRRLSMPSKGFFVYGDNSPPQTKKIIAKYYESRVKINTLLYFLESIGKLSNQSFEDVDSFINFLIKLKSILSDDNLTMFRKLETQTRNKIAKSIDGCSSGPPVNMDYFARYGLGKKQTDRKEFKEYDQSFFLNKKTAYKNSKWIFTMGPVSIMTMVHCCVSRNDFPSNMIDLSNYLLGYGIKINPNNISENDLGVMMNNLGLMIDSPDAEGGAIIQTSFDRVKN